MHAVFLGLHLGKFWAIYINVEFVSHKRVHTSITILIITLLWCLWYNLLRSVDFLGDASGTLHYRTIQLVFNIIMHVKINEIKILSTQL